MHFFKSKFRHFCLILIQFNKNKTPRVKLLIYIFIANFIELFHYYCKKNNILFFEMHTRINFMEKKGGIYEESLKNASNEDENEVMQWVNKIHQCCFLQTSIL